MTKPVLVSLRQDCTSWAGILYLRGTAEAVRKAGVPVADVAELVGGGAILGHRVVTLSREIHSGLPADLNSQADLAEFESLGIPLIDLVAVDMYPLEEEINNPDATAESVREKPTLAVRRCYELPQGSAYRPVCT